MALYSGTPLFNQHATHTRLLQYWTWAPTICRTHSLASKLRIEIDTSAETGIDSWNYVDYIKVFGATKLQGAALPASQRAVVYVPDEHANGKDSFTFSATDCPGDLFR